MMQIDQFALISGSDIVVDDICIIHQPTLAQIRDIGYEEYQNFLSILTIDKFQIIESLGLSDLLKNNSCSPYQLIVMIPELQSMLRRALSFFLIDPVGVSGTHYLIRGSIVSDDVLDLICSIIAKISFIETDNASQHVFASEKAKRIWEKCKKGREGIKKARKADQNLSIPNIIGAVCSRGPYTLLDVWGLTIYQLYDQFSRINTNAQIEVYGARWAAWGKDDFDVSLWFKNSFNKEG